MNLTLIKKYAPDIDGTRSLVVTVAVTLTELQQPARLLQVPPWVRHGLRPGRPWLGRAAEAWCIIITGIMIVTVTVSHGGRPARGLAAGSGPGVSESWSRCLDAGDSETSELRAGRGILRLGSWLGRESKSESAPASESVPVIWLGAALAELRMESLRVRRLAGQLRSWMYYKVQ